MLRITIPAGDLWDEVNERFIIVEEQTLELEHSLFSLSEWETKWLKPFLTKEIKTQEEIIDYIRCMTITPNVDPNIYRLMTVDMTQEILQYIDAPMTATWFNDKKGGKSSSEQITNEIIYYWMATANIPMECQYWHLNRLLTLIKVFNVKQQPKKKMSKNQIIRDTAAINAERKKQLNTRG